MNKAIAQLKHEITNFTETPIEPAPGWYFYAYETIKRINLYQASKFYGDVPDDAKFYNIINFRRDNLVSYIDVDLKDIRFFATDKVNRTLFEIYKKDVKEELKSTKATKIFNDSANQLCTFGSTVIRHYKDHEKLVDFRNFFYEPNVESLQDSRYVTQKHFFTAQKLRQVAEERGWDTEEVDRIIKDVENMRSVRPSSFADEGAKAGAAGAGLFEVYERFGYLDGEFLEGSKFEDGEEYKSYSVYVEPMAFKLDDNGEQRQVGNIVFAGEWNKDYPYSECHLTRVPGRWLGIGVFEMLFELQERFNEVMYDKQSSMKISTLHLFQTADPIALDNALDDLRSGDILQIQQGSLGLVPINNQERNLAAFQNESDNLGLLADNLSYTSDINRGTDIPSTMPATNAVLANNNVVRITLQKREDFVYFITSYINEYVLPRVEKSLSKEKVIRYLSDGDQDPVNKTIAAIKRNSKAQEAILNQEPITNEELDQVEADELKIKEKYMKRIKDAYKDISAKVEVIADNEQMDVGRLAQNTIAFLQIIAQSPQLLQGGMRQLTLEYADMIGVNTQGLELADSSEMALPQGQMQQPQVVSPQQQLTQTL